FSYQSLNHCGGRIVGISNPEQDLVLGITLNTMGAETLIHLRVSSLKRLQNGNWRQIVCICRWMPSPQYKLSPRPSRKPRVHNAGGSAGGGDSYNERVHVDDLC